MVTKRPVAAGDHQRPRANPIAAEQALMTGLKEAMAASLPAKKENISQEKVRTIVQKAVSAVARRKASNRGAPLIRDAQLTMINQSVVLAVNRPAKKDLILKKLPIQAGQVQMTALREVLTASHQVKKEILNQKAHHIQAVQALTISPKEVLVVNHRVKKESSTQEDRPIQADQHPMTGPREIPMANHQAKKENSNQGARHTPAAQILTISRKEVLAAPIATGAAGLKNEATIRLSVNQKIHPTINQNLNATLKNG